MEIDSMPINLDKSKREIMRLEIEKRALHRAIRNLYRSKLVDLKQDRNGVLIMKINDKGKEKILKYKLENMKVPQMKKWDKKWRVILFDVPESKRKLRDSLRMHLKNLDFFEFQKSVFVHPFDCENEINFLIEFYNIRPNVRFMVADFIDNELHIRKHFNLL